MNMYRIDSLAIVTLAVDAPTEEEALKLVHGFQGAEFEAIADDVNGGIDRERVELQGLSTRLCGVVIDAWSLDDDRDVPFTSGAAPDPELQTLLATADITELIELLQALRAAALGDSNDAEIDAAIDLGNAVETLLGDSWKESQ